MEEVLLKLLRLALGNETDVSLPADVDWGGGEGTVC